MGRSIIFFFIMVSSVEIISAQTSITLDTTKMLADDVLRTEALLKGGIKIQHQRVTCWFPKDSLAMIRMEAITDSINMGIVATDKTMKVPLDWQKYGVDDVIKIFFPTDDFISHANQDLGLVYIPYWRIARGKSPWLHEVIHVMLTTKHGNWYNDFTREERALYKPTWLAEGLADYLSLFISRKEGYPIYDVFSDSFRTDFDTLFIESIQEGQTQDIIPFIGNKGHSELLSGSDRFRYAPTFYYGSCSLTKFIATKYGLEVLLEAISVVNKEHEIIESRTGKTMEQIKKEWRNELGIE